MAHDRSLAPWRQRIAPVLALFFFAPVSAEYLIGYDDTIGRPVELVFGPRSAGR